MRVGLLVTHPIQYQSPFLRALAQQVELQVFFAHRASASDQARAGFGTPFDWDVDLLSGFESEFLPNVAETPGDGSWGSYDTPAIYDRVRSGRFDGFIVSGWGVKSYAQGVAACRRHGVPVVSRGDSELLTPRSSLKRWAKELAYPLLLRGFNGHLYVGVRNRQYFEHYKFPSERLFFSPHSVDVTRFRTAAEEARSRRAETRSRWGIAEDEQVALFVGRLISLKRSADVLRAIASSSALQKVRPVFAGDGPERQALIELGASLNISPVFLGFQNQSVLPSIYAAADVLALPSAHETWGLVVNEAMASGLPAVVSSACGCAPDLIGAEGPGAVFNVGDVRDLARALQSVLERAGTSVTRAGLQRISEAYSPLAAARGAVAALRRLDSH